MADYGYIKGSDDLLTQHSKQEESDNAKKAKENLMKLVEEMEKGIVPKHANNDHMHFKIQAGPNTVTANSNGIAASSNTTSFTMGHVSQVDPRVSRHTTRKIKTFDSEGKMISEEVEEVTEYAAPIVIE